MFLSFVSLKVPDADIYLLRLRTHSQTFIRIYGTESIPAIFVIFHSKENTTVFK